MTKKPLTLNRVGGLFFLCLQRKYQSLDFAHTRLVIAAQEIIFFVDADNHVIVVLRPAIG